MGTHVDLSLGKTGNTPHSGYIALAVSAGVPALVLTIFFLWKGGRSGLRLHRWTTDIDERAIAIACTATLVVVGVHSIAESTIDTPLVSGLCWFSAAIGLGWASLPDQPTVENTHR